MIARMLAVGVLVAATLTGIASPAGAALTGATFGETGTLIADGRAATVSLRIACAGGRVGFTVTLTQGDVRGVRRGAAQCNQADDPFLLRLDSTEVPDFGPGEPLGSRVYSPGPADACGHVIFHDPGGGEEHYRWCDEVLLQSEAQRA